MPVHFVLLPRGTGDLLVTCSICVHYKDFTVTLVPVSYTHLFDATLQLNGGGRMPDPYELADGSLSWERRYGRLQPLSAQVTRYFRRWSIYVAVSYTHLDVYKRQIISVP